MIVILALVGCASSAGMSKGERAAYQKYQSDMQKLTEDVSRMCPQYGEDFKALHQMSKNLLDFSIKQYGK